MAKKREKTVSSTVLVMKDGTRHNVLSDSGKYYVCETTQFRKSNPAIIRVERKEVK